MTDDIVSIPAFISNTELVTFGCRNCVWKQYYQCKHSIVKNDEFYEFYDETTKKKQSGYCIEYVQFILSLADEGDSVSSMWEKFHIYMAELQSMEDFTELKNLERDIRDLGSTQDVDTLKNMENKKELLKLWWVRMNENIRVSRQKICDREQKAKAAKGGHAPGIMSAKTINFYGNKKLEDKSG